MGTRLFECMLLAYPEVTLDSFLTHILIAFLWVALVQPQTLSRYFVGGAGARDYPKLSLEPRLFPRFEL